MKALLLAALLLPSLPALAQTAPPKGATTIIVHTPDSAATAYKKAVQGLLAQGYGIDKSDKDALFMSTPTKPLEKGVAVKLQLVTTQDASGSNTSFRGVFTWSSAATIMAHVENRELPIQYTGPGGNPTKRAWEALQAAASGALPQGTVNYR